MSSVTPRASAEIPGRNDKTVDKDRCQRNPVYNEGIAQCLSLPSIRAQALPLHDLWTMLLKIHQPSQTTQSISPEFPAAVSSLPLSLSGQSTRRGGVRLVLGLGTSIRAVVPPLLVDMLFYFRLF
ncbi:hypothetical protein BDN72DRAFT_581589 [Pluteus cervinus]|uniref:Uncharacterized protein n=1 Tax=Pluteus cervinus TaxID=181527 RepID=A0ACD3A2V9_9AGAR|nr:hypothetical protein BDN72DRAFT_581589 [Pluteus cervinus]